jgi:ADP-L-glycero-D-manno-heptose 6-epimerase
MMSTALCIWAPAPTPRKWTAGSLAENNVEYSRRSGGVECLSKGKFFHYASSASVYGDGAAGYHDDDSMLARYKPLNPYAESKWLFDQWVINEKLVSKVVGYRYFNVFGPNEGHKGDMRSMVNKAFLQIQKTGKARLFANSRPGFSDGSEERDFIYVKDVNRVMQYFLENLDKGGIFNVGTGRARSFKDLVTAVFTALGKPPAIDYFPMPDTLKSQYQYFTQADIGKLRAAGYRNEFTPLEDAVRDYVQRHLAPHHLL